MSRFILVFSILLILFISCSDGSLGATQYPDILILSIDDDDDLNIYVDKNGTLQLKHESFPETDEILTLTWTSDNTDIAQVDSTGLVRGIKIGNTTIRVYSSKYNLSDSAWLWVGGERVTLEDSRFNGIYRFSYYWKDKYGVEENNEEGYIEFSGTSFITVGFKYKNYSNTYGWKYSSGFGTEYDRCSEEIEINNMQYRTRAWTTGLGGEDEWNPWMAYTFNEDGTLFLGSFYGQDRTLTK